MGSHNETSGKIYKTTPKVRAAMKEWQRLHPGYYRRWAEANPDRIAEYSRRQKVKRQARTGSRIRLKENTGWSAAERARFRTYGVTPEQFRALFAGQGGRCAICRTSEPRGKHSWHLDHDHATRRPRGVLCHTCNIALGMLHDDPDRCRAAAAYLTLN